MIPLPPGVTINHEVALTLKGLTPALLEWFTEVGGVITEAEWYDVKGRKQTTPVLKFGNGRPSHKFNNNSGHYLLRFRNEDAGTALALILKFNDLIQSHNMREADNYVY